jgi:hypothetical protein
MYHSPPPPPEHPGDAQRADSREMAGPGQTPMRDVWQIVIIHIEGRWQPGLLTQWRLLPSGWVAHIRWRQDPDPTLGWGWFVHDPATIQPLDAHGLDAAGLGA